MVPSKNNQTSAEMIGLDWKEYENNAVKAGDLANEVMLTSPNSFKSAVELLDRLPNNSN
jgi:hypothetical protein